MILGPVARRNAFGLCYSHITRPRLVQQQQQLISRRTFYNQPQWRQLIKTAAYTAGGMALVTFAWPALRFVVIGGLGYLTYRAIRLYLQFRRFNSIFGSSNSMWWDQIQQAMGMTGVSSAMLSTMQKAAVDGLRTAYLNNSRVQSAVGDMVNEADVDLGEALDVQTSVVNVGGREQQSVEALFPVFVEGRGSTCFVQVVWTVDSAMRDYRAKESTLWVRNPDGDVEYIAIDPVEHSSKNQKRNVKDAEYRDL
ncbi:hypothetical protein LPJ78_002051 [Coemansia sp. RSA 989]|nr:hypothetical protein BX667DRAFT_494458 [Coemansia mojavensis]KAJ1739516.1 hypothetical protein LPJ68_004618 [Coemansia sp. RSA 1086]KAJ1866228.1 hypothetical protein LPJ78_002051 [Coemansia sp. RSA 989]KAJ1873458.1 hypothetical protein LPJ55_002313 [Coemansia sp. RSA 990]KAJ2670049.1 hypothetical protein IWW42_004249 [Coemansia sp. RSA 1085]